MALHGIENLQGRPVYVHAKVCVVDDTWASVGSDNFTRRPAGLARAGPRRPGTPRMLRPLAERALGAFTRALADPLHRLVYDPDGRPLGLRRRHRM